MCRVCREAGFWEFGGHGVFNQCSIYIYIHIGMDQYLLIPFLGG